MKQHGRRSDVEQHERSAESRGAAAIAGTAHLFQVEGREGVSERFYSAVRYSMELIGIAPEAGRRLPDRNSRPVFRVNVRRPFGSYLLFYSLGAREVRIERIEHGAQDR